MDNNRAVEIVSEVIKSSVNEVGLNDRAVKESKNSRFSYVTQTDEDIDNKIREKLSEKTEFPVESEESNNVAQDDDYWIVDPIDGTIPFAYGMPNYVSMAALIKDGVPEASALYSPETDDLYTCTKDSSKLNGETIKASDTDTINEEAVFSSVRADGQHKDETFRKLHTYLTRDSIVFGVFCAGFGATRVASGDAAGAVYVDLNKWDYMPTSRLVQSSGGVVGSLENGETGIQSVINTDGGLTCFASTEGAFNELYENYHRLDES